MTDAPLHSENQTSILEDDFVKHLQENFERTRNPVFAWKAILLWLGEGEPLPQWLNDYLHGAAENFVMSIQMDYEEREAELVAKAFGFGGEKKGKKGKIAASHRLQWHRFLRDEVEGVLRKGTNVSRHAHT